MSSSYEKTMMLNKILSNNIPKINNVNNTLNNINIKLDNLKQQEINTQELIVETIMPMLSKFEEYINDINDRLTALETQNNK